MVFNLINEKWIPVRRLDGKREIIAPWQVTDNIGSNPIVSLDANRPDFNGALIQFLIGLVQTTMAPNKDKVTTHVLETTNDFEFSPRTNTTLTFSIFHCCQFK